MRITGVTPGGHRHIIPQACLTAEGETSLPQPGPAKQGPQRPPRQGAKLRYTKSPQSRLFQERLSDLPLGPMATALISPSV